MIRIHHNTHTAKGDLGMRKDVFGFSLALYVVWCGAGLDLHQKNGTSEPERLTCLNVSCLLVHL